MKLRTLALCSLVVALALPTLAADNKSPMKAGKWQISMSMDMPGMQMPPMVMTHCITKEQAERPEPPKSKQNSDCEVSDYKMDGNTVTWSIECKKQDMKGTGKMTFNGDSYDGSQQFTMSGKDISQKFSGKYLGPCDEEKK